MKRRGGGLALAAALPPLAGCSDLQSALAPHGPDAERIALLGSVLFVGAGLILLIVLLALSLALWGPAGWRRALAGLGTVRIGGIAFPVVTLSLLLAYGLWIMRAELKAGDPPALRIEVTGEQWWWRLAYIRPDGSRIAEANEIRLPVGSEVELVLGSADVIHSFWVPSLGGKLDLIPGRSNRLRLTAERPGSYRGQCAEYCGGPHALMALEIVAMPPGEFEAWLAAETPRTEPATELERRGRDLFLAAGCGSCHTVRGIAANGSVGPDLSRVGGRRFLAAATIPGGPANIARFIAEGEVLKPGNQMPPFKIFSSEELQALSTYLASLK
jgi:cytochrome c oxidase subunit II